jgi:excisionase family DNA binding protein
MGTENNKLLSIDQVCEHLNLGRWSVYRLINQNRLKSVKIGKRRLVSASAVRAFVEKLEQEGDEA